MFFPGIYCSFSMVNFAELSVFYARESRRKGITGSFSSSVPPREVMKIRIRFRKIVS